MNKKYLKKLEFNTILENLSNYCLTYIGKDLSCNLVPSASSSEVLKFLQETTQATSLIIKKHNPPLDSIPDIAYALKLLESNNTLSMKSLLELANILKLSANLKDYYFNDNEDSDDNFPILEIYFSNLYTNVGLCNSIFNIILDEITIDDHASSNLYSIRRKQKTLEENIKNKLNSFIHSSTYSRYIQESVITVRNDRYVIPVKEEYRNMVKGFIHDISSSGSTVFIEPMSIFESNNEISNLKIEENNEIEKILTKLTYDFYPIVNEIKNNISIIGTLDFIFAKAKYSMSINGTEPKINEEKYVKLVCARHPLIDKNAVVPIDVEIGTSFRTLVITGPNTGGKTVTLKTIGLLTLMACSGLHIPVKDGSSICVFDSVYADIGDEQSIAESLSTFSSHITNIVHILNESTSNSLVLLDELCSGTDPIEGSSLAISLLETFYNKGLLTIATTHYPEIKNYALVNNGFENASSDFDIENLRPTYKLLIGIPGKSNAFAISKKLGLDENIISNAESLINSNDISVEELLKNIYDSKLEIEKEKENIEKNSNQIELLRKQLEIQSATIKEKESIILEKAKLEARTILSDTKTQVSSAIQEINKSYDSLDNSSVKNLNNIRNKLNDSIKNTINPINMSSDTVSSLSIDEITINLPVFITTLNQHAIVSSLPNKSGDVQVQIGSLKMMVPINNLIKDKSSNTSSSSFSTTSYKTDKSRTATTEINVIGLNVEEAVFIIDKYLDDCYLAKLSSIRIVHGKGTGILRKGIHSYLKNNPHVKSFRLGTFGEGEMGVTVVELK